MGFEERNVLERGPPSYRRTWVVSGGSSSSSSSSGGGGSSSSKDMEEILGSGMQWALKRGMCWKEDLLHTEEHGW